MNFAWPSHSLIVAISMAMGALTVHGQEEPGAQKPPQASQPSVLDRLTSSLENEPALRTTKISGAETDANGVVHVQGTIADEGQRALIESHGLKALTSEVQKGILSGPISKVDASAMRLMETVSSPSPPGPEPPRPPDTAPIEHLAPPQTPESERLAPLLESSLQQVPGLESVRILDVSLEPSGSARIYGVLPSARNDELFERVAPGALASTARKLGIATPVTRVDSSHMRREFFSAVQELLPHDPSNCVAVVSFDPGTERATLWGLAESPAKLQGIARLNGIRSIDSSQVLIAEPPGITDLASLYNRAIEALRRNSGPDLEALSKSVIRRGSGRPDLMVKGWYLLAAAHLLNGLRTAAYYDLVVASSCDEDPYRSSRFAALESFQGPKRALLENMLRSGFDSAILNQPFVEAATRVSFPAGGPADAMICPCYPPNPRSALVNCWSPW
jgi:hypothetical protein